MTPPPKKTKAPPKSAEKIKRKNAGSLPSLPSKTDNAEMAKKMACEKARQQAAAKKNACKKGGQTAKAKAKARANKQGKNKKIQASAASRVKVILEKGVKANKERKEKDASQEEESPTPKEKDLIGVEVDAAESAADPMKRSMSQQVLMALRRASTADKVLQESEEPPPVVDPRSQHNRRNRFYRSLGSPLARTIMHVRV